MNGTEDARRIRPATVADAAGIAALQLRSWHDGLGALLPPGALHDITLEQREQVWRSRLRFASRRRTWLVEQAEDGLLGFVSAAPTEPPEDRIRSVQLVSVHVRAEARGKGLGTLLTRTALPDGDGLLWVGTDDADARAFFRRRGFEPDGASTIITVNGHGLPSVRLVR